MHALKARVENGRYIIDEKADLPDGTELYLVPAHEVGDFGHIADDDREALEASIHEGLADLAAGHTFAAADVIAEIRSRS
jgi:hypothetical protein